VRQAALQWLPAVNRHMGFETRVASINRQGHSPTEESNEQLYRFFEYFLKHRQAMPARVFFAVRPSRGAIMKPPSGRT